MTEEAPPPRAWPGRTEAVRGWIEQLRGLRMHIAFLQGPAVTFRVTEPNGQSRDYLPEHVTYLQSVAAGIERALRQEGVDPDEMTSARSAPGEAQ